MKPSRHFWRGLFFIMLIAALCSGLALPFVGEPAQAAPQMQATSCLGTTITQWTFTGDVTTPSTGAGTFSAGPGLPATAFATGASGGSDRAVTYDGWPSAIDASEYIDLLVPTSGRNSIEISFDYRSTGTGPATLELHYSTDGVNFTLSSSQPLNNNSNFHALSFDLSAITGLDDNSNATFRLYVYGANAATGTLRLDNITFTGECLNPGNTNTPTATNTGTATTVSTSTGVVISEFRTKGPNGGNDEFIELYNRTTSSISIGNWIIRRSSGCGTTVTKIATIPATVTLAAGQHYLIGGESYSGSVTPNLANQAVSLGDDGGIALFHSDGVTIVDQVGLCNATRYLEATPLTPLTTNTNRSYDRKASSSGICVDSNNNFVDFFLRTPSDPQNLSSPQTRCGKPTPIPTATLRATPTRTPSPLPPPPLVAINEFVPRPGHDWNNDGAVNVGDEYIEILNHGVINVNLSGYSLDDEVNIGSSPFRLPSITIEPGQRIVFYGSETGLLLSDGGDGVRLLKPNGQLADAFNYRFVNYPDESICRLPDNGGLDDWNRNCYPTPGLQNSLRGRLVTPPIDVGEASLCPIADTLPNAFTLAECPSFGNIWRRSFWDRIGWYGEMYLPESSGKWPVFAD